MNHSHLNHIVPDLGATLAIVAPDGRDGMVQHAAELAGNDIPFIFDPGQGLPMFSGEELLDFIDKARYVAVNDYEGKLLEERTGRSLTELSRSVEALIVTKGAAGSTIFAEGQQIEIPCVKAKAIVDPTGCGDAYRAGLLHGIATGRDWRTTGQLASLMGAIKIGERGGQNHVVDYGYIAAEYSRQFGAKL